jgi:hypothetical protein
MKLLRYGQPGQEKPGVLDADGEILDLSAMISDLDGAALLPAAIEKLRHSNLSKLPKVAGKPRLGPCVGSVGKFICRSAGRTTVSSFREDRGRRIGRLNSEW